MGISSDRGCIDCSCLRTSVFGDLDQEALHIVSLYKTKNYYKKGQPVYLQDYASNGLFCLNAGKIKLVKSDNNGNDYIVRLENPGAMIGHTSLLASQPHYTSAIALEDSQVCFFEKKNILDLISKSPSVAINVIKTLTASLKSSELNSVSKTQQNVREKLACLFLDLKKTNGVVDRNSYKLDIKLSRGELASLIGSTTETVCRLIAEFKSEGLIKEHDKTIYIINEEKLKSFAHANYNCL